MKQTFQTGFRPNYELYQGLIWLSAGLMSSCALYFWLSLAPISIGYLTLVFWFPAIYYLFFARSHKVRKKRLSTQSLKFMSMKQLEKQMRPQALFLGTGFDWTAKCAQQVADLYQDHVQLDQIRSQGKGATFLHGMGEGKDKPVYLQDDESKGHVLIIGTTGAGKTRAADIIATQCIMRGEPLIVIDPKGDAELKNNIEAAYKRVGREDDFSFFHPAFPEESCAIDCLANFQRESELASRIAAIIPSDGAGDVFQSYSQNALMSIFYGIISGGEPPTILDIHEPLSHGSARILVNAIQRWSKRQTFDLSRQLTDMFSSKDSNEKRARILVNFYNQTIAKDPSCRDFDLDGLVSLYEHDSTHFSKMVASLVPVIGQLCSGNLKELLSPSPSRGRLPKSGKIVNLANVIGGNRGIYIGLDTLSDSIVGSRVGQLVLSDLTALAGTKYNFGKTDRFVNIFVDEAAEVATEKLIQLLNKGRGANFRIFIATQTLADFAARIGSKDMQEMMVGNLNSVMMLRTINPETQKALSDQLPEIPVSYIMKTASTSLNERAADGAFGVSHGERLMQEKEPMIAPQTFGDLTDLEYFIRTPRGRLVKGKLPILEAPESDDNQSFNIHSAQKDFDALLRPGAGGSSIILGQPQSSTSTIIRDDGFPGQINLSLRPDVEPMTIPPSKYPPHPGRLQYFWEALRWLTVLPELRSIDQREPRFLMSSKETEKLDS